jgi:beta-lactam-binding protein with PASTA domain
MGVVAVIAVLLIVLAWFFWPRRATNATSPRRERPDVDETELEAAEREVQQASDEENIRDWGPGSGGGQKPLP